MLKHRLRRLVDSCGVSERELNRLAGASHGWVGNLLSGISKAPHGTKFRALARALGTNEAWLLDGEGEPPTPEQVRAAVARAQGKPVVVASDDCEAA